MADYAAACDIYKLAPDEALQSKADNIERQARLTLVTGMCLHELRAPKDKVALRSSLSRHLSFFGSSGSKADLPSELRERVDLALTFKLKV